MRKYCLRLVLSIHYCDKCGSTCMYEHFLFSRVYNPKDSPLREVVQVCTFLEVTRGPPLLPFYERLSKTCGSGEKV
ncbi:hypothetical protein SERLADRAFT_475904 [Serpula lacrymans var. lacrymans S7.9]|uniref:Uncharacterized protein n=1 Tax=Serpula lacrymans var. lacrymans (strain S7.9) TaxID=578457 RepID=F8P6R8_SERL9|nr:uncharacterized protein SERLADRAFT_475904 [Serpula lacrymans var. lacrymans S7.9]EGO21134.1 hypothetical protein SERLADRAFT_475904 [Serpula lacrymans var. lacrymans S7.9]